ncbi:hypothetical protein A1O3_07871 [Capronia epimyces CBS 606.96]|uniref:Uncharacterized protein n=1 Tax=Capronia epimyces CBS 606.96 TaxID=1182542 RepID=W9XGF3_9EURO|nr:uncharacterized protein A1O3_07871 [Capronia epimyces CBS 606.96]EXJ79592.1 hypothetical protein A1O3_07871 [Capronia epimyces CBS 606.96]
MSRTVELTVRQALNIAQNSPSGQIDPQILRLLESSLAQIWRNIQAQPNTYVMNDLEFAVFNHFRARSDFQNETARKAVSRYWNSRNARQNH